jgi:hypothetical protein
VEHPGALRASLQAVYGIRLAAHDYGVLELADLVANLPPGCALWRAAGGPLAWTDEVHMLARVEHGVRVLAWMKTEDGAKGRKFPEAAEPPLASGEVKQEEARMEQKADAWLLRQQRRNAATPG